ncbi:hypothetical protein PIB30_060488 [Stylosanthes scabra]|uniref:Uncharacterized protein n=1 Tax=Stylosanthes scabra TaxID=79078 RepID=A0ABU6UKF9_9FABA|nr:hypothetical protein [Stylosanthes scabra]
MRTSYGSANFKDDLFRREDARRKTRYVSALRRTLVYYFGSPRNGGEVDLQGHSDAQIGKRLLRSVRVYSAYPELVAS